MRRYTLEIRGREYVIDVQELAADSFEVSVGDETYTVTLAGDEDVAESAITPELVPPGSSGGADKKGAAAADAPGAALAASRPGPASAVRAVRRTPIAATPAARVLPPKPGGPGTASLNAPMPGVVIEINVKPGDSVTRGQLVAILDAMKMHNHIRSPRDGTIREVCVDAGQAVGHGDPIVRFEDG